jgi:iron(III) transport system substrate-binding protein
VKMRRPLVAGAAVGLVAVMATACSSSSSSSSSSTPATGSSATGTSSGAASTGSTAAGLGPQAAALQALYRQAVAAGQTSVVLYGPSTGSDQSVYKAFEKDFPKITPSGVPVVGPPMSAKLSAEFSSGKHIGDIAYTGNTDMLTYDQQKYFASYTPVTVTSSTTLAPDSVGPNNDFYGTTVSVSGMVTNTNSSVPVPQNWSDLTNSVYNNKIAMLDPTGIGQMADIFAHLALIPADVKVEPGLKANNAQIFPATSITGPLTAVAQGAKSVALAQGYGFYLQAKASGAPVAFSLLKADNYDVTLYQGILKGAPHQLAAELYESWLFTPDGQAALAAEGNYSTVIGAVAPPGLPALASIPMQPTIPLSDVVKADNDAVTSAKQFWGG